MADDLGLNDHHHSTVVNYLRFARYQRGQHLKTIESSFENVKLSRLLEDTYAVDEVKDLLDELCSVLRGDLETELMNTTHTVVLLLCQMCSQAEHWHLRLQADISELENRELLEKVNKFEEQQQINSTFDKNSPGSPLKITKLEPLAEDYGPTRLLQMEIERLKEENQKMRDRLKEVENRAFGILEEKSRLTENLVQAQNELSDMKGKQVDDIEKDLEYLESEMSRVKMDMEETMRHNAVTQQTLESDLTETKEHLLEVQAHLELAEKELERKFSQTAAYYNMKQMLSAKNDQIKMLRKKLSEYEACDDES